MNQTLLEIKNLLSMISVKGDDVIYMAEAQIRINKLLKECEDSAKGE